MTDEPLTQADLFLEHAIRVESLAAQLRNADFATVAHIALGLGYEFTEEEFAETLEEHKDDQLDDAMLEQVVGGGSDDDDDDNETSMNGKAGSAAAAEVGLLILRGL